MSEEEYDDGSNEGSENEEEIEQKEPEKAVVIDLGTQHFLLLHNSFFLMY